MDTMAIRIGCFKCVRQLTKPKLLLLIALVSLLISTFYVVYFDLSYRLVLQLRPFTFKIGTYWDELQDFVVYGNNQQQPMWHESRQLAIRLLEFRRRLERKHARNQSVNHRDLHQLQIILLDFDQDVKFRQVENRLAAEVVDLMPMTCPEEYRGPNSGAGWVTLNCTTRQTMQELVTLVVNARDTNFDTVLQLLKDFEQSYSGMPVIVTGLEENLPTNDRFSNVRIVANTKEQLEYPELLWNDAFKMVNTPFTLVGRDMIRFTKLQSDLDRVLRVLTEVPGVGAVGGALRNATGYWTVECFQSKLDAGSLRYQKGYYRSQNESMYCDYMEGPFLVYTRLLRNYTFDGRVGINVFHDFFLRISEEWLAMVAPDVMFYADSPKVQKDYLLKDTWTNFSQKWQLNCLSVNTKFQYTVHQFSTNNSCSEVQEFY